MKLYRKLTAILLMCGALAVSGSFTSCSDDDEFSTQQYKGGVSLNVWGPRPVARGGELRFLGSGLDQITSITLPGSGDITDIKVISSNEIRITVPQDAQPGYVVLHYAKGEIKSQTELSFTEPIAFEGFTPSVVKPGETLTLTGDYLNLIKEIIFTEEVSVSEDNFITHTRKEITLAVPAEAKTGVVIISDGNPDLPNYIYSEEELTVILPTVESVLDLTGVKPGNEITIKGEDLNLITKVVMPNGDEVEFTYNEETGEITFVLPANVSDGTIRIVPASGVEVAAATIGIALPEDVVADPAAGIWAGDIIKFKGVNMEIVTEILFPGVEEAVKPEAISATELSVVVPEGAQSGKAKIYVGSGAFVEADVKTLCPEAVVYNPSPAALAGNLEVTGRNMQNVKAIIFGSAEVEVTSPTETGFSVVVPATISGGNTAISFIMTNGETVEAPSLVLDAPQCCYAIELPGEDVELMGGETAVLTVENADKLTGVKINGTSVQYILNKQTLIVQLPEMAGPNSTLTLVSSNGEISYKINVIPATHVENVIFNQVIDLSWSGDEGVNKFRLYKESFEGVPAGAKLVFHISPAGANPQIQINDANWGQVVMLEPAATATVAEAELTKEFLDRILTTDDGWSTTACVIQGQNCVVSKVHVEWENSAETVVFEGEYELAWGPHLYIEKEKFEGIKAGAVLRAYFRDNISGYQLQLNHDNWDGFYTMAEWSEPKDMLEYTLTADDINGILNPGEGIYGMILQGAGNTLVKLTWENQ